MKRIISVSTLGMAILSLGTVFATAAGNPSIEPEQSALLETTQKTVLNKPVFCTGADGHEYVSITAPRLRGKWLGGRFNGQRLVFSLSQTYRTDNDWGWATGTITVKDSVDPTLTVFKGSYTAVLQPGNGNGNGGHEARGWLDGVLYQAGQPTTQHILGNLEGALTSATTSFEGGFFRFGGSAQSSIGQLTVSTNEQSC
jgi:hypothetical protein